MLQAAIPLRKRQAPLGGSMGLREYNKNPYKQHALPGAM